MVIIFESKLSGHRNGYVNYFKNSFHNSEVRIGFRYNNLIGVLFSKDVLFSTADDYFIKFFFISLFRKLIGKKTVALLIRAEYCLKPSSIKHKIKRLMLILLLKLNMAKLITIMPFTVEPALENILSGWIYDPAFFMRNENVFFDVAQENFLREMVNNNLDKKIILFLGALSKPRGFIEYTKLVKEDVQFSLAEDFFYIAAGKNVFFNIDETYVKSNNLFVYPNLISESTFNFLLDSSWCVWCAYSKDYDQFSGIFCNAFVRSKYVLLTPGSRIERFAISHGSQFILGCLHSNLYRLDGSKLSKMRLHNTIMLNGFFHD